MTSGMAARQSTASERLPLQMRPYSRSHRQPTTSEEVHLAGCVSRRTATSRTEDIGCVSTEYEGCRHEQGEMHVLRSTTPEENEMTDNPRKAGPSTKAARKPYRTPKVRTYGNIQDITRGNADGVKTDKAGQTVGKKTTI